MQLWNRFLRVEIQKQIQSDAIKDAKHITDDKFGGHEFIAISSPAHISVEVEKSLTLTKNSAKITLWNLSRATLKIMQTTGNLIRIHAGYGEDTYLIFVGRLQSVQMEYNAPDRKYTLTVGSAWGVTESKSEKEKIPVTISNKLIPISISKAGSSTWSNLLTEVTKNISMGLQADNDLMGETLGKEFSFTGTAAGCLEAITKRLKPMGYYLYNKYNQIIIWNSNSTPKTNDDWGAWKVQRITTQTGLIETSDATNQVAAEVAAELKKKGWTRRMVKCKALLQPLCDINSAVAITSTSLSLFGDSEVFYGIIEDIKWNLSNYEENFYIEFFASSQAEIKR